MMKKILTYIYIVCLFSCVAPETKISTTVDLPYFDLKSFFEKEIKTLSKKTNFKKTTSVNKIKEEKKLEQLDFEKELSAFISSDINRQAWFDKYSIDSTHNQGQLQKISYNALSERLKIRSLIIEFSQKSVSKIEIVKTAETALADSDIQLIYEPKHGYSISNNQDLTFGEDHAFFIKVEF